MKMLMPIVLAALFLVGCEKLEGQLNVTKAFVLKNSQGENHDISVGTYSADLGKSTFGKKIVLRLNNNQDEKFNFTIPEGTNIPENGSFKLSSSQIGQNVDLAGSVRTVSTDSPMRDMVQQCTVTQPVTYCYPTPQGQVCRTEMRTIYGQQWVRFFDRTITQDINMMIAQAGTGVESAQFLGGNSWIQRIIVNQTMCR